MKWLIASDIHGSAFYCKKLLECYKNEQADRLLLLGDVLYHGPRNALPKEYNPVEVIELLNEIKDDIICVRGNCDTEVDQMVLKFPIMADYTILSSGKKMIFATHGHIFNCDNLPSFHEDDVLLHGHTHIPKCEKIGKVLYCNPGSVSIPKEDSENSYMIFEDGHLEWKTLDGNTYNSYDL